MTGMTGVEELTLNPPLEIHDLEIHDICGGPRTLGGAKRLRDEPAESPRQTYRRTRDIEYLKAVRSVVQRGVPQVLPGQKGRQLLEVRAWCGGRAPGLGKWKSIKELGPEASGLFSDFHKLPKLEIIGQTAKGAEPEGAEPLSSSRESSSSESSSSGSSSTSGDSSSSTTSVESSESEAASAEQERLWKIANRIGVIIGSY